MDDDAKLTLKLGGAIVVVLALVFVVFASLYDHPMPEKDCSKAHDYPVCRRAYDAEPWHLPSMAVSYLSLLLALLLMAGLVYVSFCSSVFVSGRASDGETGSQAQKAAKKNGKGGMSG